MSTTAGAGAGAGWAAAGVQTFAALANLGVGLHSIDKQNRRAKEANDLAREQFEYEKNKYNDAKAGQAKGIASLGEGFANFNKKEIQKEQNAPSPTLAQNAAPQTSQAQSSLNPSGAQNSEASESNGISESSAPLANATPSLQSQAPAQNAPTNQNAQNAQNLAPAAQNAPKNSESSAQEQKAELPTERL